MPVLNALLIVLGGLQHDPVAFALCGNSDKHIAIKTRADSYLVRVCLAVEQCPQEKVFARLRCQYANGRDERQYIDTRVATVNPKSDRWGFFLTCPRFGSNESRAVYQMEIGYVDPKDPNEFVIVNSLAWKVVGKDLVIKDENDELLYIPVPKKAIAEQGGKFFIESVYEKAPGAMIPLKYGFVEGLPEKVKENEWAERSPNR
jgi:hypothetical protein